MKFDPPLGPQEGLPNTWGEGLNEIFQNSIGRLRSCTRKHVKTQCPNCYIFARGLRGREFQDYKDFVCIYIYIHLIMYPFLYANEDYECFGPAIRRMGSRAPQREISNYLYPPKKWNISFRAPPLPPPPLKGR